MPPREADQAAEEKILDQDHLTEILSEIITRELLPQPPRK